MATETSGSYTSRSAAAALCGAAGFLSNPETYLYALVPLAVGVLTYFLLDSPTNKSIFLRFFLGLSIYSFVIGSYLFDGHQLTDIGLVAELPAILIGLAVAIWLGASEKKFSA